MAYTILNTPEFQSAFLHIFWAETGVPGQSGHIDLNSEESDAGYLADGERSRIASLGLQKVR